tara:strand:+ start:10784 stop:11236 length:453 start_codon:yes stop_codon:yes gene_type:complete
MKTGYTVGQVMSKNVLICRRDSIVLDCAKLMAEKEVGSVVIVEGKKAVGILTEQDLARKVLAKSLNPETTKMEDVMSTELYTIETDKDIHGAMTFMSNQRVKHLPVVENGELQGIISFKDIIRIQPDLVDMMEFKSSLSGEEKQAIFRNL